MDGATAQLLQLRLALLLPMLMCSLLLPSSMAAMAVLLTVILIIIIGALAALGFFHYRKTGSLLPSLPKLPRSVPLCGTFILEACVMGPRENNELSCVLFL